MLPALNLYTNKNKKTRKNDAWLFLELDDNSKLCPGKTEWVTFKKLKKKSFSLTLSNKFL